LRRGPWGGSAQQKTGFEGKEFAKKERGNQQQRRRKTEKMHSGTKRQITSRERSQNGIGRRGLSEEKTPSNPKASRPSKKPLVGHDEGTQERKNAAGTERGTRTRANVLAWTQGGMTDSRTQGIRERNISNSGKYRKKGRLARGRGNSPRRSGSRLRTTQEKHAAQND